MKNNGHCKNMKPIFNRVAKTLKEENENSVIAFVDCTKETKLNSTLATNSLSADCLITENNCDLFSQQNMDILTGSNYNNYYMKFSTF